MYPEKVCQWHQAKWESGEPPYRKTCMKSGLTRTLKNSTRANVRSCTWANIIQGCSIGWHLPYQGTALWKRTWTSLWITSSVWVNSVLLQQRKSVGCWVALTSRDNKSPSSSTQCWWGQTWNCIKFCSLLYRRDLQRVRGRARMRIKGLGSLMNEERLREIVSFSLKKT